MLMFKLMSDKHNQMSRSNAIIPRNEACNCKSTRKIEGHIMLPDWWLVYTYRICFVCYECVKVIQNTTTTQRVIGLDCFNEQVFSDDDDINLQVFSCSLNTGLVIVCALCTALWLLPIDQM